MVRDPLDPAGLPGVSAGALRVLARRDDTEILILHGEDRFPNPEAGERLAWVEWLPSMAAAMAVSNFCSMRLKIPFPPDRDGWHPYPVRFLKTLVVNALNELNVTYQVPEPTSAERQASERQAWTGERIARLGFLAGLGWTAKKIADDPLIRSTANNVHRQAFRFGIALSDGPKGQICVYLPASALAVYDKAAERAQLTRDAFVRRFLIARSAEPAAVNA